MCDTERAVRRRRSGTKASPSSEWRSVELPERGTTWALDRPGPSASAPTVVLLHGLAATGALNWQPLIEPLATRFRVVALDHRGHGRGIRPDEHFTLEDCADDVAVLLDVLGVRRAVLVGYSMGGAIAQLTQHRHGHRVAGLVFLATAARFDVPSASDLLTPIVAEAARYSVGVPVVGHSLVAIHEALRALAGYDARPWLGARYVPAIVLVTSRDRIVQPRLQRKLADAVAEGRTTELRAGHFVAFIDHRETAEALRIACDEVATEAGLYLRSWEYLPWRARRLVRQVRVWRRYRRAGADPGRPDAGNSDVASRTGRS
ncbi:MAG: alpha/beta fold hydrolase [Acidimicrobiales bacterium]